MFSYVGFTNPTKIFPLLGSFYPFSILAKIQTLSEFESKLKHCFRKKDNSKDKKDNFSQKLGIGENLNNT